VVCAVVVVVVCVTAGATVALGAVTVGVTTGADEVVATVLVAVTVWVTTGATVFVTVVLVCVEVTAGADFFVVLALDVEVVALVLGSRVSITDAGCDASPIGWLKSRLAPHVTPAVSPIPRSAASVHSAVPRFMSRNYRPTG
jgi:hypothetical protein